MFLRKRSNASFTMTELVVTLIILSVIAAFGIPNYTKMVNHSKEKDAVANLELMREAVKLYMTRENGNPPPDLANVNAINSTLFLNVIEQEGNSYNCEAQNIYRCHGQNDDGWTVWFRLDTSNGDVQCESGSCPSL